MKDDKRKNIQKMDDDDLGTVNGGLSVFSRQSPNTGKYTPKEKTVLSDVVDENKLAAAGNLTDNSGMRTVTSYCSNCQSDTIHIVFSGGRGKCSVCGNPKQKL